MHILQGQWQKSQRSHIMWFLNKLQVGNVFTQCVGKSNPSHGLHYELLSTFYFIVRFFPAKCAILFISLAIILVLLPYTHTHWQASKTWPVMCFYKNIFIYIYIISVCVSASISQCRPSCLLLNCCLFLLFFLFFFCCGGYDRSYLF